MKELNKVINTIEDEIGRLEDEKTANLDIISKNQGKIDNLNKENADLKVSNERIDTNIDTLKKKLEETKALKKSLEEVSPIFDHDGDLEVEPTFEEEKEEVVEPVVEEEVSTEIEETPAEEVVEPVLEEEEVEEEVKEEEEPVVEEKTEVVEPEYDAPIQDMVKETETDDKNLFAPNNYTEYTEPTNDTTSIENNEVYSDKKAPEVGFTPEAEEKTEVVEPVLDEEDALSRLDSVQTETPLNAQDRVIEPVLSYDERDIKGMYDLSKEIPGIDDNRLMM